MSARKKLRTPSPQALIATAMLGASAVTLAALAFYGADRVTAADEKQPQQAATHTMPASQPAFNTKEETAYASPLELLYSVDGRRLFVLCQESEEIRVLDAVTNKELKRVHVGKVPRGMALSPDGARLFVTNSSEDTLSVIDTKALEVKATWATGYEPSGVVEGRDGKLLFVANRISNDISVLNAVDGTPVKRLVAGRGVSYLTLSPDGKRLYASHVYPQVGGNRSEPQSELTVIDTARAIVVERIAMHGVAGVFHIDVSRDNRLGAVVEYHPKNLVPLAHLEHGGAFVYTMTLFGADVEAATGNKTIEVPLDELDRYSSMPFAVAISPDKSRIFVSCGGSEVVLAIDTRKLLDYAKAHPVGFAEDLSASSHYVIARIPVGMNPRGLVLSRDGAKLLVANRLDDTISIIDTHALKVSNTIALASPKTINALRVGERTFYTARQSFQGQIGCANCHIDSTFDGMTWDLEPDGFGRDIVDNRMIEDLSGTEPFKWTGTNPNIPTECGPRTEKYFWRSENYSDQVLSDLTTYVLSIPQRPHRWRPTDGAFTPAQQRGYEFFTRSKDRFGKPIAEQNRCVYCHSGAKGTNQKIFNVGTQSATDNTGNFDTPQLTNVQLTAPYLHDARAKSLEEIWTLYNLEDKHGRTNDLTKDQLNDLIEYLRTR